MADNKEGSKKTASKQTNKKVNNNKNNVNRNKNTKVSKPSTNNNSNKINNRPGTNNTKSTTGKNSNPKNKSNSNNNRTNNNKKPNNVKKNTRNTPNKVDKHKELETKLQKELVELEKVVNEAPKKEILEESGIVVTPIEDKKNKVKEYEPVDGNTIIKEEKVDIDVTEEVKEVNVVSIKENEKVDTEEIAIDNSKHDRLIDLGILIIIIGLFILVITTYLTTTTDISYNITNYLVLGAVGVQVIGIIIIICNMIRKK